MQHVMIPHNVATNQAEGQTGRGYHVSPSHWLEPADVHFNGLYCFILKFAKMGQGIYYCQDRMPGEKPEFQILQ